ncbi:DUF1015 domain-containing protein [Histomonas meleagridis]|uniref:DUF1015 domain-containing protein n=1 Tax=Histomonas meleagridis TaxID=135588 RepID=UPI00355A99AB|nr:DUF1015 domain-containing protein [Histomonas meleagridis]KAH0800752.1 DUF1015 domain-containing protein [Histomonas meleagridis]
MSGVIVQPFYGYIPPSEHISEVIAPPYDVLNREEAHEMGQKKEKCLIHVTRPEIETPELENTHPLVYQRGADNLKKWIENEFLVKTKKPGFYAYMQKLGDHVQVGIFALCSCEQYKEGIIKKHEQTRKQPELDRTITTRVQNANVGSVFLSYHGDKYPMLRDYVKSLTQDKPDRVAHLDFDNTDHELWIIDDDKRIQEIQKLFSEVDALYIADGHHRAASACNVYEERKAEAGDSFRGDEPYCYFLAAIFADTELCVIDYNRVITGVTQDTEELLKLMRSNGFEIDELSGDEKPQTKSFLEFHHARPVGAHVFSLYIRGKWYRMKFTGQLKSDNPVDKIDSKILTDFVLTPIFGITDLRAAQNIQFIGGTRGLRALEEACDTPDKIAIAVPPITMKQLFDVSDSGVMMPPKSTWFVPKLATGMVCRLIE